jgi:hypothetical protein
MIKQASQLISSLVGSPAPTELAGICSAVKHDGNNCTQAVVSATPYCNIHVDWHLRKTGKTHLTWKQPVAEFVEPASSASGTIDPVAGEQPRTLNFNDGDQFSKDFEDEENSSQPDSQDAFGDELDLHGSQDDQQTPEDVWESMAAEFPNVFKFLETAAESETKDVEKASKFVDAIINQILQTNVSESTKGAFLGSFKPTDCSSFRLKALLPEFNSQSSKSPFAQLEVMLKLLSETQTTGSQQQVDSAASVSASSNGGRREENQALGHSNRRKSPGRNRGKCDQKWHSQVYSRLPSHTIDNSSVNAVRYRRNRPTCGGCGRKAEQRSFSRTQNAQCDKLADRL